jgi:sugar lactone lactonase YvrE
VTTNVLDSAPTIAATDMRAIATGCALAESPVWTYGSPGELLWVDCEVGTLHRWSGGLHDVVSLGRADLVSAVCERDDGGLLVLSGRDVLAADAAGRDVTVLASIPDTPSGERFNDAKPGPFGRLWASTVAPGTPGGGALWSFLPSEGLVRRRSGITHGNGMGWNAAGTLMYTVDSGTGVVSRAPVDSGGVPGAGKEFFTLNRSEGIPDGLAIDTSDHVWLAVWGGSCVLRIDPTGTVVGKVDLRERNVTSCAFIGDNLGTLAITTAADDVDPGSPGGAVYTANVGISGIRVNTCTWPDPLDLATDDGRR